MNPINSIHKNFSQPTKIEKIQTITIFALSIVALASALEYLVVYMPDQ